MTNRTNANAFLEIIERSQFNGIPPGHPKILPQNTKTNKQANKQLHKTER